ncbi:class I SAM-dependent RNA methyltransferase [Celeribacter sp.]|uniref:class I SAM-dependent RNA methyltransferase n=1 Tax=Celeribacter sp. TaxID=1890673 RepID=UPI003A9234D9
MVKVTVERLGHRGDGIAEGPIYVPNALPGEVVEGDLSGDRIVQPRILEPSEHRVSPPCAHYKSCGGCGLQHASDDFVATWKREFVEISLSHQDIEISARKVLTTPPQSRRRAVFHGKRTKKSTIVGLHGRASDTLFNTPECRLMTPKIMAEFDTYHELTRLGASRRGEITLTVTEVLGGLSIAVTGARDVDLSMREELGRIAQDSDLVRLDWNGERIAARGPAVQQFGAAKVETPAGAFLQATSFGEACLLDAVREAVGDAANIADLFAGCGTFTLPLAESATVHAVEGEADMLAALEAGWRHASNLRTVSVETRDLFRRPLMPDELCKFDAVVLDPPRAGAVAQVDEITRSDLSRIAFVSCNPITFARDAKTLIDAGFTLDWVDVIDQFRWSTHVELVARFSRN